MESAWPPHRDVGGLQFAFQLSNVLQAKMEDGSGQSRVRAPVAEHVNEVLRRTGAARRNHWNGDGIGHELSQLTVEASFRPVAVHRSEQNFSRTASGRLSRPQNRVATCGSAPSGNEHLEPTVHPPGIDGHHDRLRAKPRSDLSN